MKFRRRLSVNFSLRTLSAITAGICVLLGLFALPVSKARRARLLATQVGAALPNPASELTPLHYEPRTIFGLNASRLPFLNRLANLLDEPFLVVRPKVISAGKPVSDSDAHGLAIWLPCSMLFVHDASELTDKGIRSIAKMPGLTTLGLTRPTLSSAGLVTLKESSTLNTLHLHGQQVDDDMVARIVELNTVQHLQLVETTISNRGLQNIAKMPNVSWLFISKYTIEDDHVDTIAAMEALQCLDLCGVGLVDEQVARLAGLPHLKYLQLFNNPITDATLLCLENAQQLVWLDLRDTKVTQAGLTRFRKQRPDVELEVRSGVRIATPRPLWQPAPVQPVGRTKICTGAGNAGLAQTTWDGCANYIPLRLRLNSLPAR